MHEFISCLTLFISHILFCEGIDFWMNIFNEKFSSTLPTLRWFEKNKGKKSSILLQRNRMKWWRKMRRITKEEIHWMKWNGKKKKITSLKFYLIFFISYNLRILNMTFSHVKNKNPKFKKSRWLLLFEFDLISTIFFKL